MPIKTIWKARTSSNATTPTFKASSRKPSIMATISPPKLGLRMNSPISFTTPSTPTEKTGPNKNLNPLPMFLSMVRSTSLPGHPPTKTSSSSFETAWRKRSESISMGLATSLHITNWVLVLTRIMWLGEVKTHNFWLVRRITSTRRKQGIFTCTTKKYAIVEL